MCIYIIFIIIIIIDDSRYRIFETIRRLAWIMINKRVNLSIASAPPYPLAFIYGENNKKLTDKAVSDGK